MKKWFIYINTVEADVELNQDRHEADQVIDEWSDLFTIVHSEDEANRIHNKLMHLDETFGTWPTRQGLVK